MAKQVNIRPRPRKTLVAGGKHGDEQAAGDKFGADDTLDVQARSEPADNRGVRLANPLLEQAKRPPEQIPSDRAFSGDTGFATKQHLAHKPITRGTMHARVPSEGVQNGQGALPTARQAAETKTKNDDTD